LSKIVFVVPGDPHQRTGGYRYDARILQALLDRGFDASVVGLDGAFPMVDDRAKESLTDALMKPPAHATVVVDGLALGGMGDAIKHARALRSDPMTLVALVHHPLADERGLTDRDRAWLWQQERSALACVDQVVVTSAFTAKRLVERGYLTDSPSVVCPGVDPAPLAAVAEINPAPRPEPTPANWLCVASLIPRKGHDVLLQALNQLGDRRWHCQWVGDDQRHPEHAQRLWAEVKTLGLSERIDWLGEQDDALLAATYHRASLCVLPSHYEGFGMVVTEALARGLPVITTNGGALPQTLPDNAGLIVPAGDARALAEALRQWLDDASLRRSLQAGAREARASLTSWAQAGERFIDALGLSTLEPKARQQ